MAKGAAAEPQRSCIACRRTGDKSSFIRFVLAPDNTVTPDLEERLPGRGAYLCQSHQCVAQAVSRRLFVRAFKVEGGVEGTAVLDQLLRQLMVNRITGYLALANKAGAVVSGGEAVERSLAGHAVAHLLVVAEDAAPNSIERLLGGAARKGIAVCRVLSKEQLGMALGKESDRSAVIITNGGFARSLTRDFERYRNYLDKESGR